MKINKTAWNILSEDERLALSLQYAEDKSSWESGEIMAKSHYKYLEIKYRAEKFLKLFTEYSEFFSEEFPAPFIRGNKEVKEYFRLCISERKKPKDAFEELNERFGNTTKITRNKEIIAQLKKWEVSEDTTEKTTYGIIKEFDRWNNFRILPKDIQEPSAFKRRNKNVHKKHIKILITIPPISLKKIQDLFEVKTGPYLYLPLICENEPYILKVRNNKTMRSKITELNLYLFKKEEKAKHYLDIILNYTDKEAKQCIDGLTFWPKYREVVKLAENYHEIQKIIPSRRHLELALSKLKYI